MTDPPNGTGAVIGNEQRSIGSGRDPNRTAPDFAILKNEARQEVVNAEPLPSPYRDMALEPSRSVK
jgi:hypothetical protein